MSAKLPKLIISSYKLHLLNAEKGFTMALTRWTPFSTLMRWPDIWEDENTTSLMSQATNNLDVYETDEQVVVKANVAGVDKDSIDLTYEDGVLWVKAQKTSEEGEEDKKHYRRSSWTYSYKVAVPGKIDPNKEPAAELKDGVLTVSFEKAASTKPKKLSITAK